MWIAEVKILSTLYEKKNLNSLRKKEMSNCVKSVNQHHSLCKLLTHLTKASVDKNLHVAFRVLFSKESVTCVLNLSRKNKHYKSFFVRKQNEKGKIMIYFNIKIFKVLY